MTAQQRISVVVVDDHEIVRRGLRQLLEAQQTATVVGEAGTLREARSVIAATRPDVAIIDIVLPDGDGMQLCRELISQSVVTGCLLLTGFPDDRALLSAILAGASGYLAKDIPGDELSTAIEVAAAGGTTFNRDAAAAVLDRLHSEVTAQPLLDRLSRQERRVFELIGQGMSNREIGHQLNLTEKTVKNYVSRMFSKLDIQRRTEAAVLSARLAERRAQTRARGRGKTPPDSNLRDPT